MNMVNSQQNRFRIFLDTWLARIGGVFGWIWLIFWIVPGVYGMAEIIAGKADRTVDYVMPWVCLAFAFLGILLIRSARKTKALIADFRLYCAVFAHSPEKSIPALAETLNLPADEAMNNLQAMCRRGYFNGYIDHTCRQMRFTHSALSQPAAPQPLAVISCPGCGARNTVARSGETCRYCDAPLNP